MGNIQYLKKKIETIKNIQKVTRAIKMVATVRAKKAQQVLQTSRLIPEKLKEIVSIIKYCVDRPEDIQHPLLMQRKEISASTIIVISNDHGLCGGFASRVGSKVIEILSQSSHNKKNYIISIGNKGGAYLKSKGIQISQEYQNFFSKYTLDKVYNIVDFLVNSYLSFNTDEVKIVYTSLKPSYNTEVTIQRLLPLSIEEITKPEDSIKPIGIWLLEPTIEIVLNEMIKLFLVSELNRIFHESFASEQIARMQAMDMASTNAEEFLSRLKTDFNKTRQELITKEVIELISGSNFLE